MDPSTAPLNDPTANPKWIIFSKTLIANLLLALAVWLNAKYGLQMDGDTQAAIGGVLVVLMNGFIRIVYTKSAATLLPVIKPLSMVLALLPLALVLSACGGSTLNTAAGTALAGAGTAYGALSTANSYAYLTESMVCGAWGAYYKDTTTGKAPATPAALSSPLEVVSSFCSGDPAIGSTPLATLLDIWAKVQQLNAAQPPPKPS